MNYNRDLPANVAVTFCGRCISGFLLPSRIRLQLHKQPSTRPFTSSMLRVACRPSGSTDMLPSEPNVRLANGVLPNGTLPKPSSSFPLLPSSALPLAELCSRVHGRVSAFLAQEAPSGRLKGVQKQTRISLGVIQDALRRYRSVEFGNKSRAMLILDIVSRNCHCPTTAGKTA